MSNDNYGSYNPQILDFTLHFWDSDNKWTYQDFPLKEIRFHVLGQAYGKGRWRSHLIQHRDSLPNQTKKEINSMLTKIQNVISTLTDLNCMVITIDLLDYVTPGENS